MEDLYSRGIVTRWKSRTRGLGGDTHIDVSVLSFKPSSEQVIELLNYRADFEEARHLTQGTTIGNKKLQH